MLPYCFLFLMPCLPLIFWVKRPSVNSVDLQKKIQNQESIIIFFMILLILLSLRSSTVGRDLPNYQIMFRTFSNIRFGEITTVHTEAGFVFLSKIIALLTDDFQWVIVVTAFLTIVPIALIYRMEIEIPLLTIALFVTMSDFILLFSGLRQSLAISIGVISYYFVKKHKPWCFLLMVLLAIFFHRSAFILLLLYPVYHMRITRRKLIYIVPVIILIFIFNQQIFHVLLSVISDLYVTGETSTGAYTMLLLFILFAVFSFVIPDENKMDESIKGLRNILLLCLVIQMFAPLHSLAMRFNYYFMILIPLLIPKIITSSSIRWKQVSDFSVWVMTLFFIIYFLINAPITNSLDIFPYQFFWEV